jgi:hypothetical protein
MREFSFSIHENCVRDGESLIRHLHLLNFKGSAGSSVEVDSPREGFVRSSKLIINNEISSTSERIGAEFREGLQRFLTSLIV